MFNTFLQLDQLIYNAFFNLNASLKCFDMLSHTHTHPQTQTNTKTHTHTQTSPHTHTTHTPQHTRTSTPTPTYTQTPPHTHTVDLSLHSQVVGKVVLLQCVRLKAMRDRVKVVVPYSADEALCLTEEKHKDPC